MSFPIKCMPVIEVPWMKPPLILKLLISYNRGGGGGKLHILEYRQIKSYGRSRWLIFKWEENAQGSLSGKGRNVSEKHFLKKTNVLIFQEKRKGNLVWKGFGQLELQITPWWFCNGSKPNYPLKKALEMFGFDWKQRRPLCIGMWLFCWRNQKYISSHQSQGQNQTKLHSSPYPLSPK